MTDKYGVHKVEQSLQEIHDLHDEALRFCGDDESKTDYPGLSFECGIVATLDWLLGFDHSSYFEILEGLKDEAQQEEEVRRKYYELDRPIELIQNRIEEVKQKLFPLQRDYAELDREDQEEVRYLERHLDELNRIVLNSCPISHEEKEVSHADTSAKREPYIMNRDAIAKLEIYGSDPPKREQPEVITEAAMAGIRDFIDGHPIRGHVLIGEDVKAEVRDFMDKQSNQCQRCNAASMAKARAECVDKFRFVWPGGKEHDGHVLPHALIGLRANEASHDYVEIEYCLHCGQIRGDWPVSGDASIRKKGSSRIWTGTVIWPDGHWTNFYAKARTEVEVQHHFLTSTEFRKAVVCHVQAIDSEEIPPEAEIIEI